MKIMAKGDIGVSGKDNPEARSARESETNNKGKEIVQL